MNKDELERYLYKGQSAEWLINHVIATCKFTPNHLGLVFEQPEPDGKSVRVCEDNLGYCGDDIGVFDYTDRLDTAAPSEAVRKIFEISARLDIPLGDMALTLRGVA